LWSYGFDLMLVVHDAEIFNIGEHIKMSVPNATDLFMVTSTPSDFLKIRQLTPERITRFLRDLARDDESHAQLKGATINRFHSLLSSIFRHAARQGLADVNALAGGSIPRSKESPIHVRYLGREEHRRLIRVIRQDCSKKTLEVELAILPGMRRGEQFGSKWEDWKTQEGVPSVTGKTGPRTVQISRAARRCLTRIRKRAPGAQIFITPKRNEDRSIAVYGLRRPSRKRICSRRFATTICVAATARAWSPRECRCSRSSNLPGTS
jgi:integrase